MLQFSSIWKEKFFEGDDLSLFGGKGWDEPEKTTDILRRHQRFPRKMTSEHRNSTLMTRHYPDLDSASDWLKQISHTHDQSEALPTSG